MEVKESKVIKMTPEAQQNNPEERKRVQPKKQPEKLSYEQLVDVANQLQQQNNKLRENIGKLMEEHSVIRVNFLFEIIRNKEMFGHIVEEVVAEITEALYPGLRETPSQE